MSKYMPYAIAATKEALDDAQWHPEEESQKEMTVFEMPNVFSTV